MEVCVVQPFMKAFRPTYATKVVGYARLREEYILANAQKSSTFNLVSYVAYCNNP